MSKRLLALGGVATVLLAAVVVVTQAPEPPGATGNQAATAAYTPPRTPDGQPDLQGIWQTNTYTPLERPAESAGKEFFTEEEALDESNYGLLNVLRGERIIRSAKKGSSRRED